MAEPADRMVGRAALARGWIAEARLAEAVAEQERELTAGGAARLLGAILVARGDLTAEQLDTLLAEQARAALAEEDTLLGATLVRNGLASWDAVAHALGRGRGPGLQAHPALRLHRRQRDHLLAARPERSLPDAGEGPNWASDWPIFGISWGDGKDYCAWLTKRSAPGAVDPGGPQQVTAGRWTFSLPTEDEWEKAARGPDGRFFPWGAAFDRTFCRMLDSRTDEQKQQTLPEPFGLFPLDEGPYGVRDLGGGMREMTATLAGARGEWRIFKGGAWSGDASLCRGAFRFTDGPDNVTDIFGLRLAARRTP